MKTIEEKAKAYDEAFERAKQIRNGNPSSGTAIVVCEQIFPELAEIEDERVIRTLYHLVKDHDWVNGATKEEVLAWLEKQKNLEGDFARGYDSGYEACLHSHGAEWFEKQKDSPLEDFSRGYNAGYYHGVTDNEQKSHRFCDDTLEAIDKAREFDEQMEKKQKPLTPEDKVKHPLYVEGFEAGKEVGRQCEKVFGEQKPSERIEQCVNKPENVSISDEYKIGYEKGIEKVLKYPHDYGLSEPAEWSEEDEKKLEKLSFLLTLSEVNGSINPTERKELGTFLKSLRPQPHWKPSEQQMNTLEEVIKNVSQGIRPFASEIGNLVDLRTDLLKLK